MSMFSNRNNDNVGRGRPEGGRLRASDLPNPKNREEAEALCEICRAQIEEIDLSIRNKSASQFPSESQFETWKLNAETARSRWSTKFAEMRLKVETMLTRDAQVEDLKRQIAELRASGGAMTALSQAQNKATARRNNLFLERCYTYAVLRNDAPTEHKEQLAKALQARIPYDRYVEWLRRARDAGWKRRGPLGRFDAPGKGYTEKSDDQVPGA